MNTVVLISITEKWTIVITTGIAYSYRLTLRLFALYTTAIPFDSNDCRLFSLQLFHLGENYGWSER